MVVKSRTNMYQTKYHLIFVTKYRENIFNTIDKQNTIKISLETVAENHEIKIISQEVMPNHVSLLISFPPKYSISEVVKKLKGSSARNWFTSYPETKNLLWNGNLWHNSYFVSTVGGVSPSVVDEYIESLKDTPPKA